MSVRRQSPTWSATRTPARLAVRLAFADDGVRLTVEEDDGVGFDRQLHARADDGSSLGLPGMVERARLVGGRLANVRVRAPAPGTTVEMSGAERDLAPGS